MQLRALLVFIFIALLMISHRGLSLDLGAGRASYAAGDEKKDKDKKDSKEGDKKGDDKKGKDSKDAKEGDKKEGEEADEEEEDREPEYDEDCPPDPEAPKESVTKLSADASIKEQSDPNKDVTDVGTNIINSDFFAKPETFYSFLKTSIEGLDNAIGLYRSEKGLEESAITWIFKGGNLLRMIANRAFALLPLEAGSLLKTKYAEYFKRSDNDFSVFIDDKKLGDLSFQEVFDGVADQIFLGLDSIRKKLIADPKKSFDLFALEEEEAIKKLSKVFGSLQGIDAVKDPENKRWYKAKFTQLQILNLRGNEAGPNCPYRGQYDFKYEKKGNTLISKPKSEEANWIANTDNRNVEIPWGIDPTKKYKFALLRSKVIFDYAIEIFGQPERRGVGGELLDIVITHQGDSSARGFIDNMEENLADYSISNKALGEKLTVKAHSLSYLPQDILAILFETFDKPWKSGEKYIKRVNRFFFLSILEMLGNYGIGSQKIADYVDFARKEFLTPMGDILLPEKKDKTVLKKLDESVQRLQKIWPELKGTNVFWEKLVKVVNAAALKPEEGDHDALVELLGTINGNLETAKDLAAMPFMKVNVEDLYKVDIRDLF